ncbi:GTP 3',8-cyclase MoaA [Achromobacter piechaudii]|uniref:GTP 3',8-cyclase n=1 Tax=Achromobacter piechaudii TaxID=72556 RepID=A0ABN7F356_9BURK|nr:GTP 3',8-cyclase MoaA [Achromobacter piechaudii]CAB3722035.1 GTP 3',8-cyclase [Achromobacter piechaudii]CAB3892854.1 GTP 3',8-cyclase [Achromobacter piechaudii]CAB3957600.1 GTP 3',8-cyclase [Achromobacter piechaudii]
MDSPAASSHGRDPAARALVDGFGRRIDYLRVSVTDRCDLRCSYCLPKDFKGFETPANWLTHAEMARVIGLFVGLGVAKLRLTGGEPLLRRSLTDLAGAVSAMAGVTDLSVSTNGTRLARHALALRAAGVTRLNISLDTLDANAFSQITGRDCLADVLAGLQAAREAGFAPIKLNSVVHAATPHADVRRLLDYAVAQGFVLRLIEPMPMGACGQGMRHADLNALGAVLAAEAGLVPAMPGAGTSPGAGPARYWTLGHGAPVLGVITPMSRHFCASCNRVRLGVDGTLYLCLGQEDQVPLGRMLRAGATDVDLTRAILDGIAAKPERHDFLGQPERIVRFMAQTGG